MVHYVFCSGSLLVHCWFTVGSLLVHYGFAALRRRGPRLRAGTCGTCETYGTCETCDTCGTCETCDASVTCGTCGTCRACGTCLGVAWKPAQGAWADAAPRGSGASGTPRGCRVCSKASASPARHSGGDTKRVKTFVAPMGIMHDRHARSCRARLSSARPVLQSNHA